MGKKPKAFFEFAKKNKLRLFSFEYSGHGKSSGKFIDGNIQNGARNNFINKENC